MISKKMRGLMFLGALALTGIMIYQLFFDFQTQAINEEIQKNPSSAGETAFKHFDATQFVDQHLWLGDKVAVVYEEQLLGAGNQNFPPQEAQVKQILSSFIGKDRLIFIIPSWVIMSNGKLDKFAKEHADWYLQVITWAREILPQTNLGIEISTIDLDKEGLNLLKPVLSASDSFYPAFDVAYDDFFKTLLIMDDVVSIAKILDKPLYPFMWHKGSGGSYQGKILPDNIIEQQCQFVRNNANGLVWWSGAGETWNGGVWYPAAAECFK